VGEVTYPLHEFSKIVKGVFTHVNIVADNFQKKGQSKKEKQTNK